MVYKEFYYKINMTFPSVFKYDYDDTYFCISVTVNEKIPEFKEKIQYSKNFNLYTNLNENQNFSGLKNYSKEMMKISSGITWLI